MWGLIEAGYYHRPHDPVIQGWLMMHRFLLNTDHLLLGNSIKIVFKESQSLCIIQINSYFNEALQMLQMYAWLSLYYILQRPSCGQAEILQTYISNSQTAPVDAMLCL